jgi:hypothetical protein
MYSSCKYSAPESKALSDSAGLAVRLHSRLLNYWQTQPIVPLASLHGREIYTCPIFSLAMPLHLCKIAVQLLLKKPHFSPRLSKTSFTSTWNLDSPIDDLLEITSHILSLSSWQNLMCTNLWWEVGWQDKLNDKAVKVDSINSGFRNNVLWYVNDQFQ